MADFPTLLYTWSVEKGTPFGRSLPVYAIIGSTPLHKNSLSRFVIYAQNETYVNFFVDFCHVCKTGNNASFSDHEVEYNAKKSTIVICFTTRITSEDMGEGKKIAKTRVRWRAMVKGWYPHEEQRVQSHLQSACYTDRFLIFFCLPHSRHFSSFIRSTFTLK